jgi:uncharacterized RDD family membrane protein YckC
MSQKTVQAQKGLPPFFLHLTKNQNRMTRLERLEWCNQCTNRAFHIKQGRICGLTQEVPTFEDSCPHYQHDPEEAAVLRQQSAERGLANAEASRGQRFANYLIDQVVFLALAFLLGILLAIFNLVDQLNDLEINIIALLILYVYYAVMESAFGQTVGKLITGTIVVDLEGNRPSTKTILIRSLCRFIPFEPFSYLSDGPGWHDMLAKTKVISKKYYREGIDIEI